MYRSVALDALRGFAIITMILSGRIPFGTLPGWMYHVQVPPPLHKFNPAVAGISWVDLVFPFFLFAMGAAFPIALSKRLEKGDTYFKIISQIFTRGALLAFFAVVLQHIRPWSMAKSPGVYEFIVALAGFVALFLIFWRFPDSFSKDLKLWLRVAGFTAIIVILYFVKFPDGSGFKFNRYDIIILVLANVSVFGSLIWLFTKKNILLRLGIMALLFAFRLSSPVENEWINEAAKLQPSGWLFNVNFLKYLFIVIPGTIAGDFILQFAKLRKEEITHNTGLTKQTQIFLTVLMFLFTVVSLVGLYTRDVFETTIIGVLLSAGGYLLFRYSGKLNEYEKITFEIYKWSVFFFILGLILEPFEGGIKKDHSTMSYYFLTSGLAGFMFTGFSFLFDIFKKEKYLNLLISNGQNPMLIYGANQNLLTPVIGLIALDSLLVPLTGNMWLGALRGLFYTLILAYFTAICTKYKIYWRS